MTLKKYTNEEWMGMGVLARKSYVIDLIHELSGLNPQATVLLINYDELSDNLTLGIQGHSVPVERLLELCEGNVIDWNAVNKYHVLNTVANRVLGDGVFAYAG